MTAMFFLVTKSSLLVVEVCIYDKEFLTRGDMRGQCDTSFDCKVREDRSRHNDDSDNTERHTDLELSPLGDEIRVLSTHSLWAFLFIEASARKAVYIS